MTSMTTMLPFQSGTASGSCGTVSWQIEHLDTRLIVMWSVPFNFNLHDSYFAVGMIFNRGKFTSSGYWFNQVSGAVTRSQGLVSYMLKAPVTNVSANQQGQIVFNSSKPPNPSYLFPDVLLGEGSVQAGERRADHHLRELCRAGARPHGCLHVPPAAQHISDTAGMKPQKRQTTLRHLY